MTIASSKSVVLASSSITRHRLLESAGVIFEPVSPRVDEDEIKQAMVAENASPPKIAEVLAEQKAQAVSRKRPEFLVIGADQILELDGQIYSKPTNQAEARAALIDLRGNQHNLISFVCIVRDGQRLWHKVDTASLIMRDFSDEFLDAYLASIGEEAYGGPGSYRIEEVGSQLFSKITGDYFTILGLPLLPLLEFLRAHKALPT